MRLPRFFCATTCGTTTKPARWRSFFLRHQVWFDPPPKAPKAIVVFCGFSFLVCLYWVLFLFFFTICAMGERRSVCRRRRLANVGAPASLQDTRSRVRPCPPPRKKNVGAREPLSRPSKIFPVPPRTHAPRAPKNRAQVSARPTAKREKKKSRQETKGTGCTPPEGTKSEPSGKERKGRGSAPGTHTHTQRREEKKSDAHKRRGHDDSKLEQTPPGRPQTRSDNQEPPQTQERASAQGSRGLPSSFSINRPTAQTRPFFFFPASSSFFFSLLFICCPSARVQPPDK